MIDLDEIERLARALPQEELHVRSYEPEDGGPTIWQVYTERDESVEATLAELWSGEHDREAWAKYIAALNPAAVLELVERVKEAERRGMEKAAEFAERRAQDLDGDGSYRGGEVSRLARDLRAESAMKRAGEG